MALGNSLAKAVFSLIDYEELSTETSSQIVRISLIQPECYKRSLVPPSSSGENTQLPINGRPAVII